MRAIFMSICQYLWRFLQKKTYNPRFLGINSRFNSKSDLRVFLGWFLGGDDEDDLGRWQPSPAMNCKEPLVGEL